MLTAIAGFVNAVALAAGHLAVTHLTGSVSQVSGDLVRGNTEHGVTLAGIVAAFIAGAAAAGAIIGDPRLRTGRPYGIVMLIQAALLALSALLINPYPAIAVPIASASAGMQNAMASSYGTLILRTTHVTGIATDIGLLLGQVLRRHRVEAWKLTMLSLLFISFFSGGVVGWIAAARFDGAALLLPAGVLAIAGGGYFAWRLRQSRQAHEHH
jgi:uncharacterized membrane protein YoaK (UPF0700 family)